MGSWSIGVYGGYQERAIFQHGSASSHTARNDYTRDSRGNEPRPELRQAITKGKRLSKSLDHYHAQHAKRAERDARGHRAT